MKRSSDYKKANDKVTEMMSLSTLNLLAVNEGYVENFTIEEGKLKASSGKTYTPAETQIANYYRFEGDSDPGDNITLYLIETTDGTKGTVANGMGAYSDENMEKFLAEVDRGHKKIAEGDGPADR